MAPSRTGYTCHLQDVLQLSFLNDFFLVSIGYVQNNASKSTIVDFGRTDIQNLEETGLLPGFWGKTGQINWPVRHPEARPEVL
jgi:hypothetical protein